MYKDKKKRNWFILGIIGGVFSSYGAFYINDGLTPSPKDYICKKGKLYEQIIPNSTVYIKNKEHQCLDKTIIK